MGLVALLNYSLESGIFDLSNANIVLAVTPSGRLRWRHYCKMFLSLLEAKQAFGIRQCFWAVVFTFNAKLCKLGNEMKSYNISSRIVEIEWMGIPMKGCQAIYFHLNPLGSSFQFAMQLMVLQV